MSLWIHAKYIYKPKTQRIIFRFLFIYELNYGIGNFEDVLLWRISWGSLRSYWSTRLDHNLWELISKCLMNTILLKVILDSDLSHFISAGKKVVEVRYPFQAGAPAAAPERGPTVGHIFHRTPARVEPPSLLWMNHFWSQSSPSSAPYNLLMYDMLQKWLVSTTCIRGRLVTEQGRSPLMNPTSF